MRSLIKTYTLEPAGSHGVWGLDDHSFIPYIFGSAQLSPAINETDLTPEEGSLSGATDPSGVVKTNIVERERRTNLYFSAIGFIYDVKRGPFWEHSPMLYDISGIRAGWGKINKVSPGFFTTVALFEADMLSRAWSKCTTQRFCPNFPSCSTSRLDLCLAGSMIPTQSRLQVRFTRPPVLKDGRWHQILAPRLLLRLDRMWKLVPKLPGQPQGQEHEYLQWGQQQRRGQQQEETVSQLLHQARLLQIPLGYQPALWLRPELRGQLHEPRRHRGAMDLQKHLGKNKNVRILD